MKKIYLLFVMLTLALGVFAQSKGKNAMTLRLVDIKVTDGTLVNIAKEQEAKGNTKPMDMIRIYEGNVRAKLDEVAKASGRFEISDENALEALTRDAEASLFMKMSRAEKIEYVSSKQNDYTLSCDINSCQFTRRAGGAGYSCVLQFQVSLIKYRGGERQSEVVGAVKVQDLRASTSAVSFTEGKDRIIELIPTLDANSFLQCRLLLLKSR